MHAHPTKRLQPKNGLFGVELLNRPAGRCLQLVRPIRGRAGRKVCFIITGADPVHGKKFPVITMIPTKTLTPKIIHKHNFIGCDPLSMPPGDHLHHGGLLFNL